MLWYNIQSTMSYFKTLLKHVSSAVRLSSSDTDKRFCFPPEREDRSCSVASYSVGTGTRSPGVKRCKREFDHSPPSSAHVKNEWRYTSTPYIGLNGVDRAICFCLRPFVALQWRFIFQIILANSNTRAQTMKVRWLSKGCRLRFDWAACCILWRAVTKLVSSEFTRN
jgi:hypothetical protein